MQHGTQGYFLERARCARRTSLTTATVGLALVAGLLAMRVPAVRDLMRRQAMRFGFEGHEQYVRRIQLDTEPRPPLVTETGVTFRARQSLQGGRAEASRSRAHARPETRPVRTGPGSADMDLMAIARQMHLDGPVFRSEELVIEKLVRPDYPEEAREKGLEGPVALIARVDEYGKVVGVDVVNSTGVPALERAATTAVWQCRFRPYTAGGRAMEIYAVFRFHFRLY